MVKKIISGGQTGADRTGLEVAKELGIETGGTAPHLFRVDGGNHPELGRVFGLVQHKSWAYPPRTKQNVQDSDGTVIFGNIDSVGSRMTMKFCIELDKPWTCNPTSEQLKDWIEEYGISVLNVAGNRAKTNPDVISLTRETLLAALKED